MNGKSGEMRKEVQWRPMAHRYSDNAMQELRKRTLNLSELPVATAIRFRTLPSRNKSNTSRNINLPTVLHWCET